MSTFPPKNATAGAAASTHGGPQGGHGQGPSEADILTAAINQQVNFFLIGLISLVILFRLPSLIVFLRSRSGRPILQVFRSGSTSPDIAKGNDGVRPKLEKSESFESCASDETMTDVDLTNSAGPIELVDKSRIPPPHIASVPSFLDRLVKLLRVRVTPGYTLGQAVVLMNYTYVMLYGGLRLSNPFTDGVRTGVLAVSQLPLIFALAQKNSILGSLLGYGYETVSSRSFAHLNESR